MQRSLEGVAKHVMRVMGKGHRESIYHNAMVAALNKLEVFHRSEVVCPIKFMGEVVGFGKADLVMGDTVVEIKANAKRPSEASAQLNKYIQSMTETEKRAYRGLVINFNSSTGNVDFFEHQARVNPRPLRTGGVVKSRFFKESKLRWK
jgi:GxxExxY protein